MTSKLLLVGLLFAFVFGCDKDDIDQEMVNVAIPKTISYSELRTSVEVESPKSIVEAGKIYAFTDYIFVNDYAEGVHILDNSDPTAPVAHSYLKIPGNYDISIKDYYLYADSAVDLLVFDISNIDNIRLVERLENVFPNYDFQIPVEAEFTDFSTFDYQSDIIIGWDIEQRPKKDYEFPTNEFDVASLSNKSPVGQGGSLARFQIVSNYLYTVGTSMLNVFDISNLSSPNRVNELYSGFRIETMFYADKHLYLGADNGMYIYDIIDPATPTYVSEFVHWEGCDPVVVDGDYAYLTLRGGNSCGQLDSVLEVIDISNKYNPTLVSRYFLDNPYGLGFKGNELFVCDGTSGLKVYDKTNPSDLRFKYQFQDVFAKDVIPLGDKLLMIGDNILYQYAYDGETLTLLSTLSL
ncbi:MAG: hypothetical protein R3213_00065 [Flavobacteriaceae bacterium]|nr:hypothetical protein [Flavobacteriaceae bacterium]